MRFHSLSGDTQGRNQKACPICLFKGFATFTSARANAESGGCLAALYRHPPLTVNVSKLDLGTVWSVHFLALRKTLWVEQLQRSVRDP